MRGAENSIFCSATKLRRKPLTTVPSGKPTRDAVSSAAFFKALSVFTVNNVFVFVAIYQSIYLGIFRSSIADKIEKELFTLPRPSEALPCPSVAFGEGGAEEGVHRRALPSRDKSERDQGNKSN